MENNPKQQNNPKKSGNHSDQKSKKDIGKKEIYPNTPGANQEKRKGAENDTNERWDANTSLEKTNKNIGGKEARENEKTGGKKTETTFSKKEYR